MSGSRFRLPRRVKKARSAYYAGHATEGQLRLLRRCLVMKPLGWKSVRRRNAHVAMGDTTTSRLRERQHRKEVA